jgi:hypothetical protein
MAVIFALRAGLEDTELRKPGKLIVEAGLGFVVGLEKQGALCSQIAPNAGFLIDHSLLKVVRL